LGAVHHQLLSQTAPEAEIKQPLLQQVRVDPPAALVRSGVRNCRAVFGQSESLRPWRFMQENSLAPS
jgi:hypothetical protein